MTRGEQGGQTAGPSALRAVVLLALGVSLLTGGASPGAQAAGVRGRDSARAAPVGSLPLRASPFMQRTVITSPEGAHAERFGFGVALSGDDSTAVITEITNAVGPGGQVECCGVAWVFTRSGETWTEQAKLDEQKTFEGKVALSHDGNTALLSGEQTAWVFARSGTTWTEQTKLTAPAAELAKAGSFGATVALSADGNTALVGAPFANHTSGGAWVFTRSGETWIQQGPRLEDAGGSKGGQFGFGLALSSDGSTALVGANMDDKHSKTREGAVWVFTRSGETWSQQGPKLTGGGKKSQFGSRAALSANGNTALIGAPLEGKAGAALVFTRSGETWSQQGPKLVGGEVKNGRFGQTVALSEAGNTALVGGPREAEFNGAAWIFTRSGETWTHPGEKLAGATSTTRLGESVSLSSDGRTALIGALDEALVFVE